MFDKLNNKIINILKYFVIIFAGIISILIITFSIYKTIDLITFNNSINEIKTNPNIYYGRYLNKISYFSIILFYLFSILIISSIISIVFLKNKIDNIIVVISIVIIFFIIYYFLYSSWIINKLLRNSKINDFPIDIPGINIKDLSLIKYTTLEIITVSLSILFIIYYFIYLFINNQYMIKLNIE